MATGRASEDAMRTSLPGSPPLSSNVGSPHGSGHDLDGMGTRSGNTMDEKMPSLKFVHFENADRSNSCSHDVDVPYGFTYLENTWGCCDSTYRDGTECPCPHLTSVEVRDMCCLSIKYYRFSKILAYTRRRSWTAPQPQGPMAQGRLMTTETHDEGLILPQAQKTNNHEVPSYSDSHANNTSKELHSGSIPFGKSLMCWHETNLLGFIAKQVPCQSGLFFETRGKCQDFVIRYKDDGIPYAINSPFWCANATITVRQSRSIEDREIGKQFVPLWKELADQLKVLFPDADDKRCIHHPCARYSLTNPQHQRSQKRIWKAGFQTCSAW